MRIHFNNADKAGCGFFRCYLPAMLLRELGHTCTVDFPGSPASLANEEEISIFQRHFSPQVQRIITQKKLIGIKVGFELDDNLWDIAKDNPAYAAYSTEAVIKREYQYNLEHPDDKKTFLRPLTAMKDFIRVSDFVTVSTAPLAKRLERFNKKIFVLPNGIIPAGYLEPLGPMHTVRIGWHGSMHHMNDLKPAAYALTQIMRERPNVILVIMGWMHPMFSAKEFEGRIEYYPWFKEPQMHIIRSAMIPLHIGLAPLEPNAFNISKSNLKLLEYGASTVCPIAQDIYPYSTTINNMKEGLLVKRHDEKLWKEAIEWAIDHPTERADMAKRLRDLVHEKFHAKVTIKKYEETYEKVLKMKPNKKTWERVWHVEESQGIKDACVRELVS